MRLSSLKLSGFKSFADSTTLHFKANRTAVVGPNGCGKSNVIDAIRWVMGESSARQLRGGSMQDVIFTGTAQRKPVGMASVELRFDNTYGKLGGAYNAYTELAVRRQVNRDGKSEYFLNGTRCRRKDITDIFLGTGLGPRSYAIIEQGMISRLVDAKPDEMRVFIEEAAGVSRYQARRKETLQHLEQAEQNLSRLHDIDSELEKQLKTLERQVKTALQYQQLEQEIHQLKVEILSFQIEQKQQQQQQYQEKLTTLSEEFKEVRVELHKIEAEFQLAQTAFQNLMQKSTPLQQAWQDAEKLLAELTAQVVQKRNLLQQNQQQLQQLEQQQQQDHEKQQLLDIQLERLYDELEQHEQALLEHQQTQQQQQHSLQQTQQQQQLAQQELQQQQQHLQQYLQQQQQFNIQHEQLSKQILRLQQQDLTLQSQIKQLQQQQNEYEIDDLQIEQQQLTQRYQDVEQQYSTLAQQYQQAKEHYQQHVEQVQQRQAQIKILQAEQKNLSTLLVKNTASKADDLSTLLEQLQIDDAFKHHAPLLEKLLSHWLNAYLLPAEQPLRLDIARQIHYHQDASKYSTSWHQTLLDYPLLSQWVIQPQWSFWQQIRLLEDYQHAIALQLHLQNGQMLLTFDGYLLGCDWQIALLYDDASQTGQGQFSHRLRLDEINAELQGMMAQQQQHQTELEQSKETMLQYEQQQQQARASMQSIQQQQQQLALDLAKYSSQQQAFAVQQQQLKEQSLQLEQQLGEDQSQRDELALDLQAVQLKIEQFSPDVKAKQLYLDELDELLEQQQQQVQQAQQQSHQLQQQVLQAKQQIELMEKDSSFLKQQRSKQQEQKQYLQNSCVPLQTELPTLQQQLDKHAVETVELQQTWQAWQDDLNQAQQQQQQCSEQRLNYQQQDEQLRQQIEEQRLAWQSVKSDAEHYQQQLSELNAELCTGLQLNLSQHQQKLAEKQAKFEKIGAVNLIASEEYQEILTRHEALSHQMQDVESTVKQLRDAMKSIDQETKTLFMKTFDDINHELQLLFPKVFNGGEASLTLEEDWQSGVKLMARPPGKRNSSLALLSGGEKALTALALVFAIFRLNPAPFCVLDEVDAPLDDANVQRFCNLVKELSTQVQFIYITHNKLAMTMATDLLGVTMPEAGTSKLVSVSIEEAKEFGLMSEN